MSTKERPTPETDRRHNEIHPAEILKHPVREYNDAMNFARSLEKQRDELRHTLMSVEARCRGLSKPPGERDFLRARLESIADDIRSALLRNNDKKEDK
jgi:hypothetical protein